MKRVYAIISILYLLLTSAMDMAASSNDSYGHFHELYGAKRYGEACEWLSGYIERLPYSMRAVPLSDLGTCHNRLGNISEANRAYEKALQYSVTAAQRDNILLGYSNNLIDGGSYGKALEILDRISGKEAIPHKFINKAHAAYYLEQYRPVDCIAMLDSCLALDGISDGLRFVALQNKAFILYEAGDYPQALEAFDRALGQAPDTVAYYRTLANAALVESRTGRVEDALVHINAAVSWFKPRMSDEHTICLRKRGEILLNAGRDKEASNCFREYFDAERTLITAGLDKMTRQERLNLWMKEKPMLSKCFLLEDAAPEFLYEVALFRRQTSLLGANDMAELRQRLPVTPQSIRRAMRRSGDVAVEFITYTDSCREIRYAALVLPKRGEARFVRLFPEKFLYEPILPGKRSIIEAVKSDRPEDKNRLYTDTLLASRIWTPVMAALPTDARRVYFAPEGVMHFLGIESMLHACNEGLELHRVTSTASLTAKSRKAERNGALLIGGLNYYGPIEDSASGSGNHEASEIMRQRSGGAVKFEYLPGTRSEVDSIHALIAGSALWHEASEQRLKRQMGDYGMVHIATHGYALNMGVRRRPELSADSMAHDVSLSASGLALTGANITPSLNGGEDGLLSARELCDMDLSGVDFVVLSACQTAQGDIVDEGAAGLVRGLKNAGVSTILATLWAVDDTSTMLFMQEFHRLLHEGSSKYDAYSGAQQMLRDYYAEEESYRFSPRTLAREKSPEPRVIRYDSPYYWAPFILIDDAVSAD